MPEINYQPITTVPRGRAVAAPREVVGGSSILGGLGSDAFLKLFIAQLKYQNPMEPMDGTQMMQQTSQFTMVETLQALSEAQKTTMGYTQMSTATGLIGRSVTALDNGERITGVVDRVQVSTDGPVLVMGNRQVPITAVVSVGVPPASTGSTSAPVPTATTTTGITGTTGTGTTGTTPTTGTTGTTGAAPSSSTP